MRDKLSGLGLQGLRQMHRNVEVRNNLSYFMLTVASGNINEFYQSRKSQKLITATVTGTRVPLYSGGESLSSSTGTPVLTVPLNLNFVVKARANVLGKLVKQKFQRCVDCAVTYDPLKLNVAVPLKNCTVH